MMLFYGRNITKFMIFLPFQIDIFYKNINIARARTFSNLILYINRKKNHCFIYIVLSFDIYID